MNCGNTKENDGCDGHIFISLCLYSIISKFGIFETNKVCCCLLSRVPGKQLSVKNKKVDLVYFLELVTNSNFLLSFGNYQR